MEALIASWRKIVEVLNRSTDFSRFNIKALGWIGFLGHPAYWAIWTFVIPQKYDDAFLRFSSSLLCLGLLLKHRWPKPLKKFFPLYWHMTLAYILPFIFTYLMLKNDLNFIWFLTFVIMIFIVLIFLPHVYLFFTILGLGIFGALAFFLLGPQPLLLKSLKPEYFPLLAFTIIAGFLFSHMARQGLSVTQKNAVLRALTGSIAHEVRTPISVAEGALLHIDETVDNLVLDQKRTDESAFRRDYGDLKDIISDTLQSVRRGDAVIRMILKNIQGQADQTDMFRNVQIAVIVNKALKDYGLMEAETKVIEVDVGYDFRFRGDENLSIYVILNLLKNSLSYRVTRKDFKITIKAEQGDDANYLIFSDNGPGISSEMISNIFSDFWTSGKKNGIGLGLPFCKRVMEGLGGDIECRSEPGEFAEFTLRFPF